MGDLLGLIGLAYLFSLITDGVGSTFTGAASAAAAQAAAERQAKAQAIAARQLMIEVQRRKSERDGLQ